MSRRRYTVLSGSIFAYWSQIKHFVRNENNAQIRVIRLKLTDGTKIVGVLLPDNSIDDVIRDLRGSSIEFKEEAMEEIKVEKNVENEFHNTSNAAIKEVKKEVKKEIKAERNWYNQPKKLKFEYIWKFKYR